MRYFSDFEKKVIAKILHTSEAGNVVYFYNLMHKDDDSVFHNNFFVLLDTIYQNGQVPYKVVNLWIPKETNQISLHKKCGAIYDFVFLIQYLIEEKYIVLTKETHVIHNDPPEGYEKIAFLNEEIKNELIKILGHTIYPTQKLFNLRKNNYFETGIKIEKKRVLINFAISFLAVVISISSFIFSVKANTIERNVTLRKETIEELTNGICYLMQDKRLIDEQMLEVRLEELLKDALNDQIIEADQNRKIEELLMKIRNLEQETTNRKE